MSQSKQNQPPRQMILPLVKAQQRERLPREVRDRCRELVAQMLMDLVQKTTDGDDNEQR